MPEYATGVRCGGCGERWVCVGCVAIVSFARNPSITRLADHEVLSHTEQIRLVRRMKNGDKRAKDKLVTHNQRLVLKVAAQYQGRGLELEDLVSEGNLGLLRGLAKFDPDRGFTVATYCMWWIRQNVGRAVADKANVIRKPVHIAEKARIVWGVRDMLYTKLGRDATYQEISDEINAQGRNYKDQSNGYEDLKFTPERVAHLHKVFRYTDSLDRELHHDPGNSLSVYDRIPDDYDMPEEVLSGLDKARVKEMLVGLNERHAFILSRRYGLLGEPATLRGLAKELDISAERARQVILQAQEALRTPWERAS